MQWQFKILIHKRKDIYKKKDVKITVTLINLMLVIGINMVLIILIYIYIYINEKDVNKNTVYVLKYILLNNL